MGPVSTDGAPPPPRPSSPVEGPVPVPRASAPLPAGPSTSVSQRNLRPVADREERTVMPVRVSDTLSGRYRLEQKIGEGGMGSVYTAFDVELHRKVAVKMLASNLVNDPELVERFEREAKLTAALDHPHIVPIYDVGRHEGRPFIVMKLLEGDTLAGLLRSRGGLPAEEALRLLKQIALGLDYIHAKGFIHRDIKAGNIFVSAEGLATILDFGILRSRSGQNSITRTGMVMGTPHYMAPEQALGLKQVDHRVDLYALAVVLFECLTGTLPFEADSELRLIQMQAHSPPPEILERAPWIPPAVAQVMRRALAKAPQERFDSASALVQALEAAYREPKAPAPAPLPLPVAPPPVAPAPTKSRRALLVSALALTLGVGALAALWPPPTRALTIDAGPSATPAPDAALTPDAGDVPDAGSSPDDAGLPPDAGAPALDPTPPEPEDAGVKVAPVNPKKKGRLNVISMHVGEPHWAQVSVDGTPRGRTPLLLELPPGRYLLRVERTGFKTQEREVRVGPGRTTAVRVDLEP